MPTIAIRGLTKRFEETVAVRGVESSRDRGRRVCHPAWTVWVQEDHNIAVSGWFGGTERWGDLLRRPVCVLKRGVTVPLAGGTVYVTHDQLEAPTLSTRIAMVKDGVVQQMDTHPSNLFVAEFMGNPTTNLFPAVVASAGPPASVALKWNPDVPLLLPDSKALPEGAEVMVNVRPEDMGFSVEPRAGYLPATVYATLPTGAECLIYGRLTPGGEEVVLKGPGEEYACLGPNQPFWLGLKRGNVFDAREGH